MYGIMYAEVKNMKNTIKDLTAEVPVEIRPENMPREILDMFVVVLLDEILMEVRRNEMDLL